MKNKNETSKVLLDIPMYPSAQTLFKIGDVVRSYRMEFGSEKPFKNDFIQGTVIGIESWIKDNDYIKVKWHTHFFFGRKFDFKMPIQIAGSSNEFLISINSPWLVKINDSQLQLSL